jgi:hypothetical protein
LVRILFLLLLSTPALGEGNARDWQRYTGTSMGTTYTVQAALPTGRLLWREGAAGVATRLQE